MDRTIKLHERLVSSNSDYVQAALRLAEGQGNKNHFFKQYEECFGDLDDETRPIRKDGIQQMGKVLNNNIFLLSFQRRNTTQITL